MDKEIDLEQEIDADFTGHSEENLAKAFDKQPAKKNNVPVTVFSSNKKIIKNKRIVVFE